MVLNNNVSSTQNNLVPTYAKQVSPEKGGGLTQDTAQNNYVKLRQQDSHVIMFQTTKIYGASQNNNAAYAYSTFKYDLPPNPQALLKHEFSQLKFDNQGRPDFNGYPEELNEQYTEEVFQYDERKLELVLDNAQDVTKDKINPKETLKLLEVYALQKTHEDNAVLIDGIEIVERPQLAIQNYQRIPAYQDWLKIIETFGGSSANNPFSHNLMDTYSESKEASPNQIQCQKKFESLKFQQAKAHQNEKVPTRTSSVLEIGMSHNLVGTKRPYVNASKQKIVGKVQEEPQTEGKSPKRLKMSSDDITGLSDLLVDQSKVQELIPNSAQGGTQANSKPFKKPMVNDTFLVPQNSVPYVGKIIAQQQQTSQQHVQANASSQVLALTSNTQQPTAEKIPIDRKHNASGISTLQGAIKEENLVQDTQAQVDNHQVKSVSTVAASSDNSKNIFTVTTPQNRNQVQIQQESNVQNSGITAPAQKQSSQLLSQPLQTQPTRPPIAPNPQQQTQKSQQAQTQPQPQTQEESKVPSQQWANSSVSAVAASENISNSNQALLKSTMDKISFTQQQPSQQQQIVTAGNINYIVGGVQGDDDSQSMATYQSRRHLVTTSVKHQTIQPHLQGFPSRQVAIIGSGAPGEQVQYHITASNSSLAQQVSSNGTQVVYIQASPYGLIQVHTPSGLLDDNQTQTAVAAPSSNQNVCSTAQAVNPQQIMSGEVIGSGSLAQSQVIMQTGEIITGPNGQQQIVLQPVIATQQVPQTTTQTSQGQVYGYIQTTTASGATALVPVQINQPQPSQSQTQAILVQTNQGPMYMSTTNNQAPQVLAQNSNQAAHSGIISLQAAQTSSGQTVIYATQQALPQTVIQPQQQLCYQLATTSTGQQVLIPVTNQTQTTTQPTTFISTDQGLIAVPANSMASIQVQGVQENEQKPIRIVQTVNEYGQVIQTAAIQSSQQENEHFRPEVNGITGIIMANASQNQAGIIQGTNQVQQQPHQQVTLIYDSSTQSYIQVQQQPIQAQQPQAQIQYFAQTSQPATVHQQAQQQQTILAKMPQGTQQTLQDHTYQGFDYPHINQNNLQHNQFMTEERSLVPSIYQTSQNQQSVPQNHNQYQFLLQNNKDNCNQPQHSHADSGGICQTCHKAKTLGPQQNSFPHQILGQANQNSQQSQNFQQYKQSQNSNHLRPIIKTEQVHGGNTQIVYQPYQVIKGNIRLDINNVFQTNCTAATKVQNHDCSPQRSINQKESQIEVNQAQQRHQQFSSTDHHHYDKLQPSTKQIQNQQNQTLENHCTQTNHQRQSCDQRSQFQTPNLTSTHPHQLSLAQSRLQPKYNFGGQDSSTQKYQPLNRPDQSKLTTQSLTHSLNNNSTKKPYLPGASHYLAMSEINQRKDKQRSIINEEQNQVVSSRMMEVPMDFLIKHGLNDSNSIQNEVFNSQQQLQNNLQVNNNQSKITDDFTNHQSFINNENQKSNHQQEFAQPFSGQNFIRDGIITQDLKQTEKLSVQKPQIGQYFQGQTQGEMMCQSQIIQQQEQITNNDSTNHKFQSSSQQQPAINGFIASIQNHQNLNDNVSGTQKFKILDNQDQFNQTSVTMENHPKVNQTTSFTITQPSQPVSNQDQQYQHHEPQIQQINNFNSNGLNVQSSLGEGKNTNANESCQIDNEDDLFMSLKNLQQNFTPKLLERKQESQNQQFKRGSYLMQYLKEQRPPTANRNTYHSSQSPISIPQLTNIPSATNDQHQHQQHNIFRSVTINSNGPFTNANLNNNLPTHSQQQQHSQLQQQQQQQSIITNNQQQQSNHQQMGVYQQAANMQQELQQQHRFQNQGL